MNDEVKTIGQIPPGLDKSLNPDSRSLLMTTNNRLLAANVILFMAFICSSIFAGVMAVMAKDNEKLTYVKLSPDGTWFIDTDFAHKQEVDFFPATIDHILNTYVTRRFREDPATVRNDYGAALVFMDHKLAAWFKSASGFDAAAKAAAIRACDRCETRDIEIRDIHHFDIDKVAGESPDKTSYRTNIYINEHTRSALDNTVISTKRAIISLRWRLTAKQDISRDKKVLMVNPIGLKIIEEKQLDDPS